VKGIYSITYKQEKLSMDEQIKVVIYTRSQGGKEKLKTQMVRLEAFAKSQGWLVTSRIMDDEDGSDTCRGAVSNIYCMSDSGAMDVLLISSMDKITTSLDDAYHFLARMEKENVIVYSVLEGVRTINNSDMC